MENSKCDCTAIDEGAVYDIRKNMISDDEVSKLSNQIGRAHV